MRGARRRCSAIRVCRSCACWTGRRTGCGATGRASTNRRNTRCAMAPSEAGLDILRAGTVIPAHPLALTATRQLDARRQRALARYYIDAGAGGLAVGVHATQFAIREAGLYEEVLRLAAETAAA